MRDFNTAAVPTTPKSISVRARELDQSGQYLASHALLKDAIQANPQEAILYHAMGNHYRQNIRKYYTQGVWRVAMDYFAKAYALAPNDIPIVMSYGGFLAAHKKFDKAEKVYAGVFDDDALHDVRLLTAMGHVYQQTNEYELASSCFALGKKANPDDTKAMERYDEIAMLHGINPTAEQALPIVKSRIEHVTKSALRGSIDLSKTPQPHI